jgi:hypothetical protein
MWDPKHSDMDHIHNIWTLTEVREEQSRKIQTESVQS